MKEHKPNLKTQIILTQINHFCSCFTFPNYKRNAIGRELSQCHAISKHTYQQFSNNLFQRRVRDRYLSEVPNKKSYSEFFFFFFLKRNRANYPLFGKHALTLIDLMHSPSETILRSLLRTQAVKGKQLPHLSSDLNA